MRRHTGPGLLESVYEQCLCNELGEAGIPFQRQVGIPVIYKAMRIGEGFRADIEAQLYTYLRMSGLRAGLILNFNVRHLRIRASVRADR